MLAVAAQAQVIQPNYGYGLGVGGYYPAALGVRTAYTGYPSTFPYYGYPTIAPAVTSSQYHAQDELGQAQFGYAFPGQASTNYRDAFGNQIGSYSYFNPDGKEVRVSYTADHRGFRVLSNDLPVAPVANLVAPLPVQDTPEVAQAKATHLAAVEAAKLAAIAPAPAADAPVATAETAAADVPVAETPVATETAVSTESAPAVSRRKRQAFGFVSPQSYGYGSHFGYPYTSPFAYNYASPYGYNYAAPYYASHLGYNNFAYPRFGYNIPASTFASPAVETPTADAATTTTDTTGTTTA